MAWRSVPHNSKIMKMCSLSVIFNWRNCHKHKLPNQLTAKTRLQNKLLCLNNHHTTTILRPFYRDDPGEPVPEENFWTLWCKRRLTEADTPTIQLGGTPSGLSSAHLHHPPYFLQAGCVKQQHWRQLLCFNKEVKFCSIGCTKTHLFLLMLLQLFWGSANKLLIYNDI